MLAMLFATCADKVWASETTLDLGLVVQGEEASVLIEGKSITITVIVDSFQEMSATPIDGVMTLYSAAAASKIRSMLQQNYVSYNTGLGINNIPLLQTAYIYFFDSLRMLNAAQADIIAARSFYFNSTRPELDFAATEISVAEDDCRLKYETDSSDARFSNLFQVTEDLLEKYNAEFALFTENIAADGTVSYTTELPEKNVTDFSKRLASDADLVYSLSKALHDEVSERMHLLQGATSGQVTKQALDLVKLVPDCVESSKSEDIEIDGTRMYNNAMVINYTVVPFVRAPRHSHVHAVPYMIREGAYQLDLDDLLVIEEQSGLVLDHSKCEFDEGLYKCPPDYLRADPCVQSALDTLVDVPKNCKVRKIESNPVPLIVSTPSGKLIAQRSTHAVRIAHGATRIRQDPVIVQGPEDVIVSYHQGSKTLKGLQGSEFAIHASPWTEEERDDMYYRYNVNYLQKYIPDSYSDTMYLILVMVQAMLAIPVIWNIFKFLCRCCGVNLDTRPPAWLQHMREWELRRPSPSHEPAAPPMDCEEQIPLQPMPRERASESFVSLARNARSMTLDEFLGAYEGDANDLTNFYIKARAGPSTAPRRNIQFGYKRP